MAAPTSYPSWAYNQFQPALIVQNLAQFNALPPGGTWSATPYPSNSGNVPSDPGFTDTDTRLQQILIENRVSNLYLASMAQPMVADNPDQLRAEVLALDSNLSS